MLNNKWFWITLFAILFFGLGTELGNLIGGVLASLFQGIGSMRG